MQSQMQALILTLGNMDEMNKKHFALQLFEITEFYPSKTIIFSSKRLDPDPENTTTQKMIPYGDIIDKEITITIADKY